MKNGGFTIIELLIVTIILSILLTIAGVSGKAWLDRYRVEGQMKEMYVDLMNARARAMQKNRMHFVTLTSLQYTIYEDRDPGHATDPAYDGDGVLQLASDAQVLQKNLNTGYAITSGSSEIDFDPRGLATGLTGTQTTIRVTTSYGAAYDCITVSATRIRMGKYNGSTCDVQ